MSFVIQFCLKLNDENQNSDAILISLIRLKY